MCEYTVFFLPQPRDISTLLACCSLSLSLSLHVIMRKGEEKASFFSLSCPPSPPPPPPRVQAKAKSSRHTIEEEGPGKPARSRPGRQAREGLRGREHKQVS